MDVRYGRQTPTTSVVVPYTETQGGRVIERYKQTGREPQPWQEALIFDIRAVNGSEFAHMKFGYQVPRRNGKGEILTMVELDDLFEGRKVLHTAHRATTSSSAALRLATVLKEMGYKEVMRIKNEEDYPKSYVYAKQFGLEKVTLLDTGGTVDFRTRTAKGGLGEGFDTLIIDEAQEYTDDQESSLQYVVSDSMNPQTILCGTPPTMVSSGTVFKKLRDSVIAGQTEDTGWAEWSVPAISDCNDVDLWYETNPAMGYHLTERKIKAENKSDELDFNIQRLGYWSEQNLKSDISLTDWNEIKCESLPEISGDPHIGIKFTTDNVAVSIAARTKDGRVFFEGVDSRPIRAGNLWIVQFCDKVKPGSIAIDGNGAVLKQDLDRQKIRGSELVTTRDAVVAYSKFEQMLYAKEICHYDQPSMRQAVTNCRKRPIGANGGFGYRALFESIDAGLIESAALAIWKASEHKEKKKQVISY